MRFIHIADVHLGAEPEAGTAYSKRRPDELWETFSEVVSLCEQEQTDLLLIAGDLFHRQPLLRELKEVDYLFSKLTHTEVVLIAGNHDHIRKDSYYRTFSWSENVHPLFGNRPQYLVLEHLDTAVYGFSYEAKEILEPRYDGLCAQKKAGIEILLAHGGDEKHIPINGNALKRSGFDYVALGHIHKPQIVVKGMAAYAGALEPTDKNDTGKHGFIRGEIRGGETRISFVLGSNRRTAYRTSAHFSLAFYDRGSQTGTSGVPTASTVISRKHAQDRLFSFIDFHRKFLAGHSKEDTDKQSCSADDRGGDQNSCQHTLRPP